MSQKGRRARSEILSHSLPATHAALREWTGRPSHLSRCPTTPLRLTATARLAHPTTSVARMRCGTAANACPTCPLTTRTMAPLPLAWPHCTALCWAIAVRQTFTPIHEPSALTSEPHRPGDGPRDRTASVNQSNWGSYISTRLELKRPTGGYVIPPHRSKAIFSLPLSFVLPAIYLFFFHIPPFCVLRAVYYMTWSVCGVLVLFNVSFKV